MAKFVVQLKGHPGVEVDAKDKAEAIELAKAARGLDGIGHEVNGLLVSCEKGVLPAVVAPAPNVPAAPPASAPAPAVAGK